jgi:hypothetical protein
VADGPDDAHVPDDPVLGMGDRAEDELDGDRVGGTLVGLREVRLSPALVGDGGVAEGDPLDESGGEDILAVPVVDLVFDGRGAAVEGEYDHGFSFGEARHCSIAPRFMQQTVKEWSIPAKKRAFPRGGRPWMPPRRAV